MSTDDFVLVGDIGGTHARFAVVNVSTSPKRIDYRIDLEAKFPDFQACLRSYLAQTGLTPMPNAVALAVAGPVTAGSVKLTNRAWQISESELQKFGFRHALLINDFAALAFSVSTLTTGDFHTIGPEIEGLPDEPVSILGAGTGFGASCLARFRGRMVPIATEGGHAGFAPSDERQIAVLSILARRFGHVSIERVLSGPGIENLYGALTQLAGRSTRSLTAAEIASQGESDQDCRETVEMFCAIYGSVAGDFALAHGARGGVFLAGGIAQKIEKTLQGSAFRAKFENKGRLSSYVKAIPTRLVLKEDTTFLGAAVASLEFRDRDGA